MCVIIVYYESHAFPPPVLFFAKMLLVPVFSMFGNQLIGFCKEPSG